MTNAIKNALRIAKSPRKPVRFHHTVARKGYQVGGHPEDVVEEKASETVWQQPQAPAPVTQPDDAHQEAFIKEQLKGSAPQYDPAAGMHTAKEAGLMAAGMVPGTGLAAAAGKFPTAEGGFEPSLKEDISSGHYGSAFLKGLGAAGDVVQAVPVVGTAAGAAMKAPLAAKLAMAVAPAAKLARETTTAGNPVQDALRVAYQRQINPAGMYSHAAETAANLPQAKGSYEQMMAMLRKSGVKPEELHWSGVEKFAGQPVTREQLVEHFEQNVPEIKETVLGSYQNPYSHRTADEWQAAISRAERQQNWDEAERLTNAWEEYEGYGAAGSPKFSEYTIPGGENYREVLLGLGAKKNAPVDSGPSPATMLFQRDMMEKYKSDNFPSIYNNLSPSEIDKYEMLVREDRNASKTESMLQDRQNNYKSSHWDEPNVLAHLRMSDRTGPEGEKVLHLEEIQSDWGQEGRKKGFAKKVTPELQEKVNIAVSKLDPKFVPAHARTSNGTGIDTENFLLRDINHWREAGVITPEDAEALTEYSKIKSGLGIPSAPYVASPEGKHTSSWIDLGLKRALKEAAEGGYGKLVWTPGAEQAARYDLSKKIKNLAYDPEEKTLSYVSRDSNGAGWEDFPGNIEKEQLADYVGKDAAEKLLAQEPHPLSGLHVLEDLNLVAGGEGMTGFYDKILPSQLQKLIKKMDPEAKIALASHVLEGNEGQILAHALEISPKLREAILKGLPAYSKGGKVDHFEGIKRRGLAISGKFINKSDDDPVKNALNVAKNRKKYATDGSVEGDVQFSDENRPTSLMSQVQQDIGDKELAKYGMGPNAPSATKDTLSAGPEQNTWEKAASYMMGDRPSPERRHFVEGMGNIADVAHMGAYATPAAPHVAAVDFARGIASGDPIEAGMSAAGLPGRNAKALAIAAAAMAPEQAQAGPYTKFLAELAERYRPHYDPAAMVKGQPYKDWISSVGLSRPIEQMSVKSQGHRPMVDERFMEPQELAGKALISGLGDRTPAGYEITHINDKELSAPVNMMGGRAFGRDIASQGPDKSVWGSALSRAKAIQNQARRAADKGLEPVFSYIAQGPQSGDFSHHMQDLVLGQMDQAKMDKGLASFIDKRMREAQTSSGETFAPKPDWVGVQSPEMAQRMRDRADERVKLIKLMDAAKFRDAPGFSDVGAARFASTDPDLMYDPSFSAGKSFMRIDPHGSLVINPKHVHPSYDTQIPAGGEGHGYLGRLEYELPPELHYKHFRENEINPNLRGKPLDKQTMSIMRSIPTVEATPEWVDMASEWQDLMRQRYGRRRP